MSDTSSRVGDYIQVYTGIAFWPLDPRPEEVGYWDIAHALSNQCRYSGHVDRFYSVAQHSVLVSHHCDPANARFALLHDAAEAYLVDLPAPLKRLPGFEAYRVAEAALERVIFARFGLAPEMPPVVAADIKKADRTCYAAEVHKLMTPDPAIWRNWIADYDETAVQFEPMLPLDAKRLFLDRFAQLFPEHV